MTFLQQTLDNVQEVPVTHAEGGSEVSTDADALSLELDIVLSPLVNHVVH
jgi:hypothetical protein